MSVDAAAGEPDAASPFVPDFESDEGGSVVFEYVVNTDPDPRLEQNAEGGAQARAFAFFIADQSPQTLSLPPIETCTNLEDDDGYWPRVQPDNRQYIDVGGVTIIGGEEPLAIPSVTDTTVKDPYLRSHDTWWYRPVGSGGGNTYSLPNRAYDVVLSGSDEWPAQVFDDALFMPQAFNYTSHEQQFSMSSEPAQFTVPDPDDPQNSTLDIEFPGGLNNDGSLTVTWDVETTNAPAGFGEEATLITVTNNSVGPKYVCLANNDGEFTIPKETVDAIKAEYSAGVLVRQVITHHLEELTNGEDVGKRRIDFVSVWCYVTPFRTPAQ